MARPLQLLPSHTCAQVQVQACPWYFPEKPCIYSEAWLGTGQSWTRSEGLVRAASGLGQYPGWYIRLSSWGCRPELFKVWSLTGAFVHQLIFIYDNTECKSREGVEQLLQLLEGVLLCLLSLRYKIGTCMLYIFFIFHFIFLICFHHILQKHGTVLNWTFLQRETPQTA